MCRPFGLSQRDLKATHLEQSRQKVVKDLFGHDIVKSYKTLPSAMQVLSNTELTLLEEANRVYREKEFEYINVADAVRAFSTFPDLTLFDVLAQKLLAAKPST